MLIFTTFLILQVSCEEEFLVPKPLSFFTPENVFVDNAGFEAALVTIRKDLKTQEFYGPFNHVVADIHASDIGTRQLGGDWRNLTPSSQPDVTMLELFKRMYRYIKNTNVIISNIDLIKWNSQEDKNSILAEALFYRSWWYYRLVHTFGDVPFIGHELKEAKLDFYTHSKFTILQKIQSDMEFAVQWLPETPKDRPSKYAGLHLLAKIYCVNLEFDKAINATTSVINGPFALMETRFGSWLSDNNRNVIWDLHRPENKVLSENKEVIFGLIDRMDAPENSKTEGSYTMRSLTPTWWHNLVKDSNGLHGTKTQNEDGTNTPAWDTLGAGNPDLIIVPWFNYTLWADGVYSWRNTPDLRRVDINWVDSHELLYNEPTSVDYGKPLDPRNFASLADSVITIYPFPIYKTWYPHKKGYTGYPMGGNGDRYVFRLAETYLIRAEAYFWKDQLDLAAADINKVRQRSKALPITSADVNIDYIFDERARELYTEEMRHTEMVRVSLIMAALNKDGYSLANIHQNNWWHKRVMSHNKLYQEVHIRNYTFHVDPHNIFWPIDVNVITANTLGLINQNEGYEGAENNKPPLTEIVE